VQEKDYFYGKNCPWKCADGRVEYRRRDCPVAEDRCERTEWVIGGSCNSYVDCAELIDEYLAAFRKVA